VIRYDPFDNNAILAQLNENERDRLKPLFQEARLPLSGRLDDAHQHAERMYFPTSGIVSLVMFMEDGATGEIAIVGNEGLIGTAIYMGGTYSTSDAIVQVGGRALALPASFALEEFNRLGNFHTLLLQFSQALTEQIAHTALCNRHHRIEQQLARWLLMSQDRLDAPDMTMTQELIANMLGVRREGVSTAAYGLQESGIISYRRGKIRILDRDALQARSCECYQTISDYYAKLGIS